MNRYIACLAATLFAAGTPGCHSNPIGYSSIRHEYALVSNIHYEYPRSVPVQDVEHFFVTFTGIAGGPTFKVDNESIYSRFKARERTHPRDTADVAFRKVFEVKRNENGQKVFRPRGYAFVDAQPISHQEPKMQ